MSGGLRVLVVDHHRAFADLLVTELGRDPEVDDCDRVATVTGALELLGHREVDVVLFDAELAGADGVDRIREVCDRLSSTLVVLMMAEPDLALLAEAAEAGVDAFLSKATTFADLRTAVLTGEVVDVDSGSLVAAAAEEISHRERDPRPEPPVDLTPREREVLALLARGVLVQDAARLLGVTTETCRGYVKAVLMKLGARSQLQAVVRAVERGLVPMASPGSTG